MTTNFDRAQEHLDNAEKSDGLPALREAIMGVGFALLAAINDHGIMGVGFALLANIENKVPPEKHIIDNHGRHWVRDSRSDYFERMYRRTGTDGDPTKIFKTWSLDNAWELMDGMAELYAPDDCPVCTESRAPDVDMIRVTSFKTLEALV